MAFAFPSLIPSLSTFFACGTDPTLTSPTTLSLISSFCHATNSLDSYISSDDSAEAMTTNNDADPSISPHKPSTSGFVPTGSPSPFKESCGECLTERELAQQAEALITLSLNDEKHYKKQQQQHHHHHHQNQVHTESELIDDTLLEQIFEIEKLKLLLEITDHDIEQFHLQQQKLNAMLPSIATVPTATSTQPKEIKRLDEKGTFVHPGFYTLPPSSSNTLLPSKFPRKRSLQEDVLKANRARAMTPPDEYIPRRHSVEGNTSHLYSSPMTASSPMIPGPLMQSHPPSYSHHWSSYATPPKTPLIPSTSFYPSSTSTSSTRHMVSTSPLQHCDDRPPGQPLVLAYDLSSPSFTTRLTSSTSTTTPYPPPRSETSSPFPAKKRRSSKFKMDPFQLNSHGAPHESPQQQRHPYPLHNRKQERQHHLSASSSPYMFSTKASSTHRHNPAQVPASMIPPDHFVFQEALQKQPWLRNRFRNWMAIGLFYGKKTHVKFGSDASDD
ncbi:hypothetical protein BG000_010607 [Podila horticola]|nr:hypothetical protein BG000_010607 [Podila horticola]